MPAESLSGNIRGFVVVVVLIGRGLVDQSQSWSKLAKAESQRVERGKKK